jgi:diacylglycerol kinase family enzyme
MRRLTGINLSGFLIGKSLRLLVTLAIVQSKKIILNYFSAPLSRQSVGRRSVEAAERICVGVTHPIDAIRLEHVDTESQNQSKQGSELKVTYAVNIVGWGFVSDVGTTADGWRWIGPSRYTLATIYETAKLKHRTAKITIDNKMMVGSFTFVMCQHTVHTGKDMLMAPQAKLDDGILDIVVCNDASRSRVLRLFPKIFEGKHLETEDTEYHTGKEFSIESAGYNTSKLEIYQTVSYNSEDLLNIDGELKGSTPVKGKIVPGAWHTFI